VIRTCIVIIAAWAVACSLTFRAPAIDDAVAQITDERAFFVKLAGVPHPVVLADYAASGWTFSPTRFGTINDSLCIGNVGLLGFSAGSGLRVIDTAGLADPITSRLELTGRTRAGHEKHLSPSWCAARIDPSNTAQPVEDARAALRCGELRELMNAITEPGGYRHVWRNMSIAVRTRNLRIPGDPQQARQRFCG
jgi:arabinofuranosyltransferase